jgi:hypothetical protein
MSAMVIRRMPIAFSSESSRSSRVIRGRAVEIVERAVHRAHEHRPAHADGKHREPVLGPRTGGVVVDEGQHAQRRVSVPVDAVGAHQRHRRTCRRRRRGERSDVERVAEKLGGEVKNTRGASPAAGAGEPE